jgi:hypothetical protein
LGPGLDGDDYTAHKQDFSDYLAGMENCSTEFDGSAAVTWSDALKTVAFSGFFQAGLPSFIRFTALNPLNQPFFAVASNGEWFQSVDTSRNLYSAGSLRSYGIRHNLPPAFLQGEWGAWLSGRPPSSADHVQAVHRDRDDRGIWISVAKNAEAPYPIEHLLLDLAEQRMKERILLDSKGKTTATISYDNWQSVGNCQQPSSISISGLSFGATAQIDLSEIMPATLSEESFSLPVPRSYRRQILP